MSTAEVSAVEDCPDADQPHAGGDASPEEACRAAHGEDGDEGQDDTDPPSDGAGTHPASQDRFGLSFAGDEEPACRVWEHAQHAEVADNGERDPDQLGGHSEAEA